MSIGNQQSLRKYAKPLFVSSPISDKEVPFSFRDWYNAHQGVIPGEEFQQYNEYLIEWYKSKSQTIPSTQLQIKLNYLTLLKQLQLFFSTEEAENWYNKVDINNEKELLLAIPYFAKKLKDIALYYFQLRETIKESRLKYNQVGTNSGILQQLQKFLLNNYTKKPASSISIPASIWRDVPELSAVKDSITIQIEELYDSASYFDHSPTVPVSAYYDVNSLELQNFLSTKGLTISSTDWIYKIGVNPLSANYLELSGGDLTEISQRLAEKYLGQDKFVSVYPTISTKQEFFDIPISVGDNFFYWPSGVYKSQATTNVRYQPVFINQAGLSSVATAGSSVEIADTIFARTNNGIEGAWYRNNYFDYRTVTMRAVMQPNQKTIFRFPFPGFGLSAEDIQWTGYSLETTPQFFFLNESLQRNIESVYWSSSIDLTSSKPLNINDTTLIDNKAYPNRDYNRADKIRIWPTPPNYTDVSYSGTVEGAWLYRMNQTDISIQLSGNSVIVWPYEKINPDLDFPSYYPTNFADVCTPQPISAINFSKAIASNTLSSADVIYKLTNYQDTPDLAVECCWLSGSRLNYPGSKIFTIQQGELQLLANSGEYTRFIWSGPDNIDVNTVFKTLKHQPNCKFAKNENATYLDFSQCDCKQVLFTPFGHPGSVYVENNGFADFIIEDNFSPSKLDLSVWRDSSGTAYTESSAFCWYKTKSKIGWGDGSWNTNALSANNNFYLQTGKPYVYYRARVTSKDKEETILPNYILRYPYNSTNQVWIRAFKNDNDEWVSTNQRSSMILNPGDILLYQRAQSTSYTLTGTVIENINVAENRGSIWTNIDYLSIGPDKSFVLSYPVATYTNPAALNAANPAYPQYPAININNIVSVFSWSVSAPGQPLQVFRNTPSVLITPTLSGIYTFSVTVITAVVLPPFATAATNTFFYSNTGFYVFSNIPPVTAVPNTVLTPTLTSYLTPAPGYVLNTPLRGWDYNKGIKSQFAKTENAGARPYWAKTYLQKDEFTGFKGIESWGTPQRFVDEYNVLTQPEISEMVLETGNYVEYTRNFPSQITWNQPLDLTVIVDKNEWCTLQFNATATSNLADQLNNFKNELVVIPTTATSQLLLQNYVNNEPVEVYYNAINSFVWPITATPIITETVIENVSATIAIQARQPWANLSNQYYPTIAAFPALNELYSSVQEGGYFIPSNLGASIYVNQDFTVTLDPSSKALGQYFTNKKYTTHGRGLTLQDQPTPYDLPEDNNIWLKEPVFTGPIAGTIKKSAFKKYQKFLPYQSGYESNPRLKIGLLNPTSRQTPWTGKEDSEWGDPQNKPTTFTGELDVDSWANSQILKQASLQIDNWCTDVFGNQYGLYKDLLNVPVHNRKYTPGEIWVRKNSQFVAPAYQGLSGVFDTYTGTNLINFLTGFGVFKIDVFFDTLLVEVSGAIIFEKLSYDYNLDNIFSVTDDARYISLAMPVSTNLDREFANIDLTGYAFAKAGETWFFPEKKEVVQSICGLSNNVLIPELYLLDINTQNLKKIFPVQATDISCVVSLSNLNLVSIDPPVLSHNSLKKEYLLTVLGKNNSNDNIIIEFKINDLPISTLSNITVYTPTPATEILDPPVISQVLNTTINITNIEYLDALNFQCNAENGPVVFEKISGPNWINLSSTGLFTGTPPFASTTYNVLFKVTNSSGPTYYSFVVTVRYIEILTIYYLFTEGYEFLGVDGFLTQENDSLIIE